MRFPILFPVDAEGMLFGNKEVLYKQQAILRDISVTTQYAYLPATVLYGIKLITIFFLIFT